MLTLVLIHWQMRKAKSKLSGFYNENKTPILVVLGLFLLYKLRGLFGIVGNVSDAIGNTVAGATAGVISAGKDAADKVAVKTVAPDATPAQLNAWRTSAKNIAAALGKLPGVWTNSLSADQDSAMTECKKYSRVMYHTVNGKAVAYVDAKHNKILRRPSYQLPVLYTFYSEVTGGRNLLGDLDTAFNNGTLSKYQTFYKDFIRPA